MKPIVNIFVLFAFTSMGWAADKAREGQADDIRGAVFIWQFEHNESFQRKDAKIYFLEVGEGADPSDEFMKRFANHKPPVHKASASTRTTEGVRDKKTGTRGLLFRAKSIEWLSNTEVEVDGGYYEHGLSSAGSTYSVQKDKGKWKVTKEKTNWISDLDLDTKPGFADSFGRVCCLVGVSNRADHV